MADPELIIDAEPDWTSGLELSYGFQTVVSITPRFVEQRRPLYPYQIRNLVCSFVLEGEHGQELLNKLIYGKALLCCVPIYTEPMFSAAITAGATSITTTTDLTYLWNIQNCDYAVVFNYITGSRQMLKVSSASGNTITLSEAIATTFTAAESVIYPAFAGIIKGFKRTDITDLISVLDCEFEEAKIQAEEYTGEEDAWTDPQVCQDDLFNPQPAILLGRTSGISLDDDGVPSGAPENEPGRTGLNIDFYYYGVGYEPAAPIIAAGTVENGYAYCAWWPLGRRVRLFILFNGDCYHSEIVTPYVAGKGSEDFSWIQFPFLTGPTFSSGDIGETVRFGLEILDDGAYGVLMLPGTADSPGWLFDYEESGSGCEASGSVWLGGLVKLGITFINR